VDSFTIEPMGFSSAKFLLAEKLQPAGVESRHLKQMPIAGAPTTVMLDHVEIP
jgi:hypothetical protein